jgi:hypothetical protein
VLIVLVDPLLTPRVHVVSVRLTCDTNAPHLQIRLAARDLGDCGTVTGDAHSVVLGCKEVSKMNSKSSESV